ncbi:hypothetical protein BB560_000732, partial [Smittium megazygosporum]
SMGLLDLNLEVLVRIYQDLPLKDLFEFAVVSKKSFEICKSHMLWERKYLEEFGNSPLYLDWVQALGISLKPEDFDLNLENQLSLNKILNEQCSVCEQHFFEFYKRKLSLPPLYSNLMLKRFIDRYFLVNGLSNNTCPSFKFKQERGVVSSRVLSLIKNQIRQIMSTSTLGGNSMSPLVNVAGSDPIEKYSLLSLFTEAIKTIFIIQNEFPWSPDCFHLLGFISFILGKDKIAKNFVNLGIYVCESLEPTATPTNNISPNVDLTGYHNSQQLEQNQLISKFDSSLNIKEGGPSTNAHNFINIKDDLINLLKRIEENLLAIDGKSNNFSLLNENENDLHPQAIEIFKKLFMFFDHDKDKKLNINELGNLVAFMNSDISFPSDQSFNMKLFLSLNLPKPNRELLEQVIKSYEPLYLKSQRNKYGNSKNYKIKQQGFQNLELSFDGLRAFYLDQTLHDPLETRNDLKKISSFLN